VSERYTLPVLLSELGGFHPKLVLMRGREYFRIEDLIRSSRRDAASGTEEQRKVLSEAIYWHMLDEGGKLIVKGISRGGDEFVAFVEPGSDTQTSFS